MNNIYKQLVLGLVIGTLISLPSNLHAGVGIPGIDMPNPLIEGPEATNRYINQATGMFVEDNNKVFLKWKKSDYHKRLNSSIDNLLVEEHWKLIFEELKELEEEFKKRNLTYTQAEEELIHSISQEYQQNLNLSLQQAVDMYKEKLPLGLLNKMNERMLVVEEKKNIFEKYDRNASEFTKTKASYLLPLSTVSLAVILIALVSLGVYIAPVVLLVMNGALLTQLSFVALNLFSVGFGEYTLRAKKVMSVLFHCSYEEAEKLVCE